MDAKKEWEFALNTITYNTGMSAWRSWSWVSLALGYWLVHTSPVNGTPPYQAWFDIARILTNLGYEYSPQYYTSGETGTSSAARIINLLWEGQLS